MYCIYHSRDLDGWMSAAIVKKWYNNKALSIQENEAENNKGSFSAYPELKLIGWDYGQFIPSISNEESVIMVDVSFPKETMHSLWATKGLNFVWIDHHISAINEMNEMLGDYTQSYPIQGLRDTKFAACELTWQYLFPKEPMPEIVRLLGRYDCFGHKGTAEERRVLEFQYGARAYIKGVNECEVILKSLTDENCIYPSWTTIKWLLDAGHNVYQYLITEAEESYKKHSDYILTDKKVIAFNKARFNPINFGIDYHKDGYDACLSYFFDGKKWQFSLYNDDGNTDVSLICKQFGGGGHKGAAGFVSDNIGFLSEFVKAV